MPATSRFHIYSSTAPADIKKALSVRLTVFVEEQGVPADRERDSLDDINTHWLAETLEGNVVGTARLTDKGNGMGKVERVAVLKDYRRDGVGRLLMERLEQDAARLGYRTLVLHAQTHSQGFYEKLGYTCGDPEPFDEEGIPHVCMEKQINL